MPETPRSYPYPSDNVAAALSSARVILQALKPLMLNFTEIVEHCEPPCAPGVVPDDEIVLLRVKLGDCRALCRAIRES